MKGYQRLQKPVSVIRARIDKIRTCGDSMLAGQSSAPFQRATLRLSYTPAPAFRLRLIHPRDLQTQITFSTPIPELGPATTKRSTHVFVMP